MCAIVGLLLVLINHTTYGQAREWPVEVQGRMEGKAGSTSADNEMLSQRDCSQSDGDRELEEDKDPQEVCRT